MDPPRPEVAAAVKICREAGIRLLAEGHEVKVIDDRVDVVLNQADILAKLIAEEMSLGDMMTLLKLRRGEYSLVEEKLPPASQFLQGSLMELPLPSTCVIAAVIRHGKVLVPRGNMRFEIGDEVLAVVDNTSLPDLRRLFAPA
jgi:trk system potassium uptake protein TrkA